MARILLLGGTGAMGVYLAPELARCGHEVDVTSRSREGSGGAWQYITGDARDVCFLKTVCRLKCYDAVVDFMIYATEEFRQRRDILLGLTGHYLFVSSYRVFADTGTVSITEDSPRLVNVCRDRKYLATDEYALAKGRQEDLLRDARAGHWTILRPGITYSRTRFQLGTLEANTVCLRGFAGLPILMAREILAKECTMTWAGDVAAMIARLMLRSEAFGDDFNLVTANHQPWRKVAELYRAAIGLRVVETDLSSYERVVGGRYQIRLDRMLDRVLDNRKILAITGLHQARLLPLEQGLPEELEKFRQDPKYEFLNPGLQARMDRATASQISLEGFSEWERAEYLAQRFPWRRRAGRMWDLASGRLVSLRARLQRLFD